MFSKGFVMVELTFSCYRNSYSRPNFSRFTQTLCYCIPLCILPPSSAAMSTTSCVLFRYKLTLLAPYLKAHVILLHAFHKASTSCMTNFCSVFSFMLYLNLLFKIWVLYVDLSLLSFTALISSLYRMCN
jgi:hypothetical protein